MGSSSSKFKKYLQHGDEYAAMQVYQNSSELRKNLQPNFSYGDHHQHNTPIHYASRHGMKHLIRAFLNDLDGNPNKRNGLRQTSLHSVCQVVGQQKSPSALERRSYSVMLLLSWRGPLLPNGQRERVNIDAQDRAGYTALHYAAQAGLKKCVEYLLAHGANVFGETLRERLTPYDLAMRENHQEIALLLESKMVFDSTPESISADSSGGKRTRNSSLDVDTVDCSSEVYSGLRDQDLQEAKDQLLVETSDILHVPLFAAEALLRHCEWSREILLDNWIRDPVSTCQLAGVQPSSLNVRRPTHHDQYRDQQTGIGSSQPYQQRHHLTGSRPNILLQGIEHLQKEHPHPFTQTLPPANKILPITSHVSIGKSAIISKEPDVTNISQVPANERTTFPSTLQKSKQNLKTNKPKMIHSANSFVVDETLAEDELLCEICCDLIGPEAAKGKEMHSTCNDQSDQQLSCGHNFCYKCWKGYLRDKIGEGKAHQIYCPGYDCNVLVPIQVMERYISPQMARKYLKDDIDAFVETNKALMTATAVTNTSCTQDLGDQQFDKRKPLTQIQALHTRVSETLPGRFRLGTYHNIKNDDPWLVKENQVEFNANGNTDNQFAQQLERCSKLKAANKEMLHECHELERTTEIWSKSAIDNTRDKELQNTQSDSMKVVVPSELLHSPMYQSVWSSGEILGKTIMKQYDYAAQYVYTLPRISRSDDNLLIEGKKRTNFPMRHSKEESQKRNVSAEIGDMDSYNELENTLATNQKNSSASREFADSQGLPKGGYCDDRKINKKIAHKNDARSRNTLSSLKDKFPIDNPIVNSFAKNFVTKVDEDEIINTNINVNQPIEAISNSGQNVQTHQAADTKSSPRKSNSIKIVRRTGEVADGKFCIGDLHESGGRFSKLIFNNKHFHGRGDRNIASKVLKRSHSTGEINRSNKRAFLGARIGHIKKTTANKIDKRIHHLVGKQANIVHLVSESIPMSKVSSTMNSGENKVPAKRLQRLEDALHEKEQIDGQPSLQLVFSARDDRYKERSKPTDCRKIRPKLVRQKSFEIDTDSTDDAEEAKAEKQHTNSNNEKRCSPQPQYAADIKGNAGPNDTENSVGQPNIRKYKEAAFQYDRNQSGTENKIEPTKEKQNFTESCNPTNANLKMTSTSKSKLLQSPKSKVSKETNTDDHNHNDKKVVDSTNSNSTKQTKSKITTEKSNKTSTQRRHPGLTIRIQNSSMTEDPQADTSPVSSEANEFVAALSKELARSPTLHISGIAISRSPGAAPLSPSTATNAMPSYDVPNRNRSASLAVPSLASHTASSLHTGFSIKGAAKSCNASPRSPGSKFVYLSHVSSPLAPPTTTVTTPSPSPHKGCLHQQQQLIFTFPDLPGGNPGEITKSDEAISLSRELINKPCETSATHALSSVLHVQDSYLSSDDFHEALFLNKKSPNKTSSRKRRKSKKKDSCGISATETLPSPTSNEATRNIMDIVSEVDSKKHEVKQNS